MQRRKRTTYVMLIHHRNCTRGIPGVCSPTDFFWTGSLLIGSDLALLFNKKQAYLMGHIPCIRNSTCHSPHLSSYLMLVTWNKLDLQCILSPTHSSKAKSLKLLPLGMTSLPTALVSHMFPPSTHKGVFTN